MLVDHLRNRIAQQHHVLVKRFDLPLKLDTVHQVNRHGHMILAQRVQERILQSLPFIAHWPGSICLLLSDDVLFCTGGAHRNTYSTGFSRPVLLGQEAKVTPEFSS
ncbi:hypothetical protein G6F59_018824 [Rhizopus arrhizus]|nr:hypothetical protein G6F59_018824 [Rhizopus arrhizus]